MHKSAKDLVPIMNEDVREDFLQETLLKLN